MDKTAEREHGVAGNNVAVCVRRSITRGRASAWTASLVVPNSSFQDLTEKHEGSDE